MHILYGGAHLTDDVGNLVSVDILVRSKILSEGNAIDMAATIFR